MLPMMKSMVESIQVFWQLCLATISSMQVKIGEGAQEMFVQVWLAAQSTQEMSVQVLNGVTGWLGRLSAHLEGVQARLAEVLERARWDPAWWMRAAGWIEYCGVLLALVLLLVVLYKLERCLSRSKKVETSNPAKKVSYYLSY